MSFFKYRKVVKEIANEIAEESNRRYVSHLEVDQMLFDKAKERIFDKCQIQNIDQRGNLWVRLDILLIDLLTAKGIY